MLYARLLVNGDTGRIACLPGAKASASASGQGSAGASSAQPQKSPSAPKTKRRSSVKSPARSTAADAAPPATPHQQVTLSGTSLEWLLETVVECAVDDVQRQLLGALVAQHWHKRCFRCGMVVVMPLLGRRVLLEVRPMHCWCA